MGATISKGYRAGSLNPSFTSDITDDDLINKNWQIFKTYTPPAGDCRLEWNNGRDCYNGDTRYSFWSIDILKAPDTYGLLGDFMSWEWDQPQPPSLLFVKADHHVNWFCKPAKRYTPIFNLAGCWAGEATIYLPECDDKDFVPVGVVIRKKDRGPPVAGDYFLINKYFLVDTPIDSTYNKMPVCAVFDAHCGWFGIKDGSTSVLMYKPFDGYGNLMIAHGGGMYDRDIQIGGNSSIQSVISTANVHNWQFRSVYDLIRDYLSQDLDKLGRIGATTLNFIKSQIHLPKDILLNGGYYDACHDGQNGITTAVCDAMKSEYCDDPAHANEPVCGCLNAKLTDPDIAPLSAANKLAPIHCISQNCLTNVGKPDSKVFIKNTQLDTKKCPPIEYTSSTVNVSGTGNTYSGQQNITKNVSTPTSSESSNSGSANNNSSEESSRPNININSGSNSSSNSSTTNNSTSNSTTNNSSSNSTNNNTTSNTTGNTTGGSSTLLYIGILFFIAIIVAVILLTGGKKKHSKNRDSKKSRKDEESEEENDE
jgi:hypothetical protein